MPVAEWVAMRWLLVIFGQLFLVISAAYGAGEEVPIEYCGGLLWVEVSTARSERPLRFLLDSGAEVSVLNLRTARDLDLKPARKVKVHGVQSTATGYWPQRLEARVGEIALPQDYLAVDLCALSEACGCTVDGLIGADFFADKVVQLDFRARKLRLLDSMPAAHGGEVLALRKSNRVWQAPVRVNGSEPLWMRLDTGCASSLQWVVGGHRATRGDTAVAVGLSTVEVRMKPVQVQLGSASFASVSAGLQRKAIFPNEDGLLGNGLLSRFRSVIVDGKRGLLVLGGESGLGPASGR